MEVKVDTEWKVELKRVVDTAVERGYELGRRAGVAQAEARAMRYDALIAVVFAAIGFIAGGVLL